MKEIAMVEAMLDRRELLAAEERQPLPHLFMMEMLTLNEHLVQLELNPTAGGIAKFRRQVTGMQEELAAGIRSLVENGHEETMTALEWEQLKEFHYKQKYLLRILQRLSTFASRDQMSSS